MKDGVIAETGNSRYLRSIAGFLQAYPTYEAFAAALIAGTLPIDWNGKNPDGWAQQGTDLNKANLLTDATAALMDLGPEATPNEMLAALANGVSSASSAASSADTKASSAQTAVSALGTKVDGMITYGTADLTPGTSALGSGKVYLVYE